jgi:hypothetical protein
MLKNTAFFFTTLHVNHCYTSRVACTDAAGRVSSHKPPRLFPRTIIFDLGIGHSETRQAASVQGTRMFSL